MSIWTGDVQAQLEAGEGMVICTGAYAVVRSFVTGVSEPVGLWQGAETVQLTVDGQARTYLPAGDALQIGVTEVRPGLTVNGQRVTIKGINQTIDDLQRVYDLANAPLDIHDFAFTPGLQFLGYRQKFRGVIDGDKLTIGDRSGEFSLVAVSALRRGTRTLDAMLDGRRDPFLKYVAAKEGDSWG